MKDRRWLLIILLALGFVSSVAAQTKFEDFFDRFRQAVKTKDNTAIARLTAFPLSMPYGMGSVKNKMQLANRYNTIFSGEADAAKCFEREKPVRENAARYAVACGFKNDPSGDGGKPIIYTFWKTKVGWRFIGFDNINE